MDPMIGQVCSIERDENMLVVPYETVITSSVYNCVVVRDSAVLTAGGSGEGRPVYEVGGYHIVVDASQLTARPWQLSDET